MKRIRNGPKPGLVRAFRENRIDVLEAAFRKAFDAKSTDAMLSQVSELLASAFKGFIQDKELPLPANHTVGSLWNVVKKHLDLDESYYFEFLRPDLAAIAGSFPSVVEGIDRLVEFHRTGRIMDFEPVRYLKKHRTWQIKFFAHAAQTLVLYLVEIKEWWVPF